jgi:hypothetical protein
MRQGRLRGMFHNDYDVLSKIATSNFLLFLVGFVLVAQKQHGRSSRSSHGNKLQYLGQRGRRFSDPFSQRRSSEPTYDVFATSSAPRAT